MYKIITCTQHIYYSQSILIFIKLAVFKGQTLLSYVVIVVFWECLYFSCDWIFLYFKITHCYQVYFDVIKALLYILSFALQFSIVMNFRHLINDIYWKLRLFLPCQKQSEFDAACHYCYIYIHIICYWP